ncbi:MAG: heat-shock protein Hsp70 [endosymbiont of Escarpia spicata]|uniref:Heat-shock protein Hsp70 n=1 Tax=endosymbiont of Escarpia spicata TaxID=2200908 RepID=A0A370DSZ9_9GAMM|nr:MAG: heat-shock protein Hsp70 [endosymbiont of Escarpia spicata]
MKNFVGIDLGTTNSAICSYDGSDTRVWKSPQQNDVTPSAIYIDRRGNKQIGFNAYNMAPQSPDNSAMLFKRLMGTSTPINLPAVNITMTPEECSAEILKVLFGYLPEEIRNDPDTGTVITVPAAFNQMQKDATMQAASMAGLGKVGIMQEPVAAVMSVMRARNTDGMFLIYDLGGGTLDIAIAESLGGRVNLLAHGGIAMCGGRDFDRVLVDNVVRPWLLENFDLPEDFSVNPSFKSLIRLATWATERAKIELSAREDSVISLSETEARVRDLSENEVYLDIPLQRDTYDKLIAERVGESIESARETLNKAGLSPHDLERIVFVGGPTNYKMLRDKVAFELGIPGSTDVNPMTAVAEGASLFAESIDWGSQNRSRKSTRGQISSGGGLELSFNYIARTPDVKAKIAVQLAGQAASGSEFQIDSVDTGWTSGRMPLKHGATLDVSLTKTSENTFKVFVFDSVGGPIALEQDSIVITRTAATVDAIPASHSIAIAVLDKVGGPQVLEYLVKSGDSLPKKGSKTFKAAESLKAGSTGSLNFALWEGEIEDPITDNRPIGVLKISGSDFDDGVIPAGADLACEYEILDSGNIIIEVSVPCIGGTFHSGKNFYSRQEGQLDYTAAATMVVEEGERTLHRIDEINDVVDNPKLDQARQKLESAASLDPEEAETENSQEAMEKVLEARRLLAQVRKEHLKEIRQIDLDYVVSFFDEHIRQHARPSEASGFDNLAKTAQRSIDRNDKDFEHHLDELKGKNFEILWRQDWFVVERFKWMVSSPHLFADKHRFEELAQVGTQLMRSDDIEKLRAVVAQLSMIQIGGGPDNEMFDVANIIRG